MKRILMNKNITTIIGIVVILLLVLFGTTGCSSFDSMSKDWESETSGGLNRIVKVYSPSGELLSTYEGKINIEYDESRVIFQIDRDKRIAVYSDTAIVVVEEK